MVAELEAEGSYLTYSTFQNYNNLQQANLRVPLITVTYTVDILHKFGLKWKHF